MKNKAFTLLELLAVITLLGVVAVLVIPSADRMIKDNKDKLYDMQIENIKSGAKNWTANNIDILPSETETISVTLNQLKQGGYVEPNIKNPKTNKYFANDMLINVTMQSGNYIYDVLVNTGSEIEYNTLSPNIVLNGTALQYISLGESYVESGAIATSHDGQDISSNIQIVGSVNCNTLGTYQIEYIVEDADILTKVVRKVIVRDDQKPVLTFQNLTIPISVNNLDLMDGVTCTDNSGSCDVDTLGTVLLGVEGTYYITYRAIDNSNNETTRIRQIDIEQ